ncbi:MAG: RNA polymerase sigma factor [Planctomycetota bacterium]|nr:RNA polymerase sigma factor [Planctomycetota bacterium]
MSENYPTLIHNSAWNDLDGEIPVLRRFLQSRCRDDFEADDVIQETLMRAARYRRHLHCKTKLRSWILRISLNVLSDRIRCETRLGRRLANDESTMFDVPCPDLVPLDPTIEVDGHASPTENVMGLIDDALSRLRNRDRALISDYYGGAMSCRETAEHCEVPVDLVKVRLFRARKRLREIVRGELAQQRRTKEIGAIGA